MEHLADLLKADFDALESVLIGFLARLRGTRS